MDTVRLNGLVNSLNETLMASNDREILLKVSELIKRADYTQARECILNYLAEEDKEDINCSNCNYKLLNQDSGYCHMFEKDPGVNPCAKHKRG